jgi:protein-S-isoprenylcysteine O-methyltransferase Ste14
LHFVLEQDIQDSLVLNFELKVPPVVVALGVAALMWLVPAATPGPPVTLLFRVGVAAVFGTCGLIIIVMAAIGFRRARTTVNPLVPGRTTRIVSTGVYRLSRNPMYLGMLLLLVGLATVLWNLFSLGLSALFVLYMNRFQIPAEERMLATLYPLDYGAYKGQVRRWI